MANSGAHHRARGVLVAVLVLLWSVAPRLVLASDCGNGVVESGEVCDDGNTAGGDGCSDTCQFEFAGCAATGTWDFAGSIITLVEDGAGTLSGVAFVAPLNVVSDLFGTRSGPHLTFTILGSLVVDGYMADCDHVFLRLNSAPLGVMVRVRDTYCGDGATQAPELCDDGNFVNTDACPAFCGIAVPTCGDHTVDPGEECDDGNTVSGDGCNSTCHIEVVCGDGTVGPGEECDDGNTVGGDGCSAACRTEICGNGVVDVAEQCDDGNTVAGDGCSPTCQIEPGCGNGVIEAGEQCDDHNLIAGDGCSPSCQYEFGGCALTGTWTAYNPPIQIENFFTLVEDENGDLSGVLILSGASAGAISGARNGPAVTASFGAGLMASCDRLVLGSLDLSRVRDAYCGDGIQQGGEVCDDGNFDDGDACPASCGYHVPPPNCGDGMLGGGEQCDDGNTAPGDGCSPTCTIEPVCGNGSVEGGEQCDDGNTAAGDGCSPTCTIETECGNGSIEFGEQCDDANLIDGDGCSAACIDEDRDDDGVLDDGDASGVAGDHPCTGGSTSGCDDNCLWWWNADQADGDGDLVGDVCDYNCTGLTGATLSGTIYRNSISPANVVPGAYVSACNGVCCADALSDGNGEYVFTALGAGDYHLYASSTTDPLLLPADTGPVTVPTMAAVSGVDLVLHALQPLPPDTSIEPHRGDAAGPPVVYWQEPQVLSISGCAGGTANYEMTQTGTVIRSGTMEEAPPGTYSATIDPLYPNHGYVETTLTLTCPDLSVTTRGFDLYIDPSGVTRYLTGAAAAGATVTLLRADVPLGPFEAVADGSAVMSPANRHNPDSTDANGHFGWDVTPGYYVVRATSGDCTVSTDVLTIPPAVLDLDLRFNCLCTAGPLPGCLSSGKSQLLLKQPGRPEQRGLIWKWLEGAATAAPDLGDPLHSDSYSVCVYDGSAQLTVQTDAPLGGLCAGKACWKTAAHGFTYKDGERTPNGFSNLSLKSGADGSAKITAKAAGANLALPPLEELTLPLRVQLQRAGTTPGQCWEATFSANEVIGQSAQKLKAKHR